MIRKAAKEWLEPNRSIDMYDKAVGRLEPVVASAKKVIQTALYQWGLVIAIVGFLLGRAMILSDMTPFVLPFLAAVYMLKRERAGLAALSLFAGAVTSFHGEVLFVAAGIVVYVLMQKAITRFIKDTKKALPYIVFVASITTRILLVFITSGGISYYALMMATVEAGLSFILTMIFLQSVPLVTARRIQQPLRNEEIICLIILLASVMTGTVGWMVYDITIEHVLARYLVLLFAFVGGAAIGSTVGVVTGLILSLASVASLYQMSLLAFSGLLGGLLKEGKKR